MAEDRLRALRAIRFASRFKFQIEPATWAAIVGSAPFMSRLSPERVRQEIEKTMDQVDQPSGAYRMWRESGAFATLVPSLARVTDVEMAAIDYLAMPGLAGKPARRSNRISALFLGAGASAARSALRELRFSNSDVAWIAGQVERWAAAAPALDASLQSGELPSPGFMRSWISQVGRMRTASLLRICAAVWRARDAAGIQAPDKLLIGPLYSRMIRSAFRDPVELGDLRVDGDDLRGVGIKPGPQLGGVLTYLLEAVLQNPELNERSALLRMAAERMQGAVEGGGSTRKPASGNSGRDR
jgi:tRNA nucleotidyltransferase (CCA-adding enzyme)